MRTNFTKYRKETYFNDWYIGYNKITGIVLLPEISYPELEFSFETGYWFKQIEIIAIKWRFYFGKKV